MKAPTQPQLPSSSGCPHGPSIEMSPSLLHWTTAACRNELRSVNVEGDISGCHSPTPTRRAALRLMSVCKVCRLHAWPSKAWTSGQEMTSRGFSETRCLLGLQKPFVSSTWIVFKKEFHLVSEHKSSKYFKLGGTYTVYLN